MSRKSELHTRLLVLVVALFAFPLLLFVSFMSSGADFSLSFFAAILTFFSILVYICLYTVRSYSRWEGRSHRKRD